MSGRRCPCISDSVPIMNVENNGTYRSILSTIFNFKSLGIVEVKLIVLADSVTDKY